MNNLKEMRNRAGQTALHLGRATGINELRIYQLERGRFPPHRAEAQRLARALGVRVSDIFPKVNP